MKTTLSIIIIFGILFSIFCIGSIGQAISNQEPFADFVTNPKTGLVFFDYLVRLDNLIKITALRSTEINKVVIGKGGALYIDVDEGMADYRGLVPYTDNQLSYILDIVKSERDYLKSKDIQLLLVVAPNKESIYPEYLPDNIVKIQPVTRLDQIEQYFKANSDIQILDLRPTLISAKKSQQVYYKSDSHWNSYGAFLAYCKIMEALGLTPHSLSDYNFIEDENSGGDLGRMLKMGDVYTEPMGHRELKEGVISEKLPSAVIFHDSFYRVTDLKTMMAPHFDRIKAVSFGQLTLFSSQLIEQEQPNVVIYIMAERVAGRYFMPWH
ncbi:MAG: DHHW family protein [Chloroflexi bacterium]|nr:DHHW family protein [Chloroflexota bacterium]